MDDGSKIRGFWNKIEDKTKGDIPKFTSELVKIRFQDCDPFQHLNATRYFNYFFNSRDDQIENDAQ